MRLRTRKQYQRMTRGTLKYLGQWVIVDIQPSKAGPTRLGITVTKRYGDAVKRNRFKRLVREAFRLSNSRHCKHFDILVKPRSKAIHATLKDIQEELASSIAVLLFEDHHRSE